LQSGGHAAKTKNKDFSASTSKNPTGSAKNLHILGTVGLVQFGQEDTARTLGDTGFLAHTLKYLAPLGFTLSNLREITSPRKADR